MTERRLFLERVAVGFAGGYTGLIQHALAAESPKIGRGIQRLQGEVAINGNAAQEGSIVSRGDVVTTGPNAQAVYVIGRDAFLQRGDSRVDFLGQNAASFMRVVTGRLLSVFGRGQKKITVPTATAGIRGTGCYIETDDNRTYFCLCFGAVELRPNQGRALKYRTRQHENPLWIENGTTTRAPMINHADAELIMLESLVGRGSPFRFPRTYQY